MSADDRTTPASTQPDDSTESHDHLDDALLEALMASTSSSGAHPSHHVGTDGTGAAANPAGPVGIQAAARTPEAETLTSAAASDVQAAAAGFAGAPPTGDASGAPTTLAGEPLSLFPAPAPPAATRSGLQAVLIDAWSPDAAMLMTRALAQKVGPHIDVRWDALHMHPPVGRHRPGDVRPDGICYGPGVQRHELRVIARLMGLPDFPIREDNTLPEGTATVRLHAASCTARINLCVYTNSPRRAGLAVQALTGVGHPDSRPPRWAVTDGHGPRIIYGAAPDGIANAAAAVLTAVGTSADRRRDFSETDRDVYVYIDAPGGSTVWGEVPFMLITDDPSAPLVSEVKAYLDAQGASYQVIEENISTPSVPGFELVRGCADSYGATVLEPLVALIEDGMARQGLDSARFTVRTTAGTGVADSAPLGRPSAARAPVAQAEVLHRIGGRRNSVQHLYVRMWLPVRAAAEGRVRPDNAGMLNPWTVRLRSRGRGPETEHIADELRAAGFGVEHLRPTEAAHEPWVAMGRLSADPVLSAAVLAIVGRHVPGPVSEATWVTPDEHTIELNLPVGLSPSERERAQKTFNRNFRVTLFHGGAPAPGIQALETRLRDSGFQLADTRAIGWQGPDVQVGGAPDTAVRDVLQCIEATFPGAMAPDTAPKRIWPAHDRDIFVHLPQSIAAPTERSAIPDPFLDWRHTAPVAGMAPAQAFLRMVDGHVWVGRVRLDGHNLQPAHGPDVDGWVIDAKSAATLDLLAGAVARREPALLEGLTATSKTSAIRYLGARLGVPVLRVNLSGHTDTSELIGRYLPVAGGGWRWCDGTVVRALREGAWLILDEINLAEANTLERLNPLLEDRPSLRLTEHDGETFGPGGTPIHPRFRIFATMNPASYAGRADLSPALRDRFLSSARLPLPDEDDLRQMIRRLVCGSLVTFAAHGRRWQEPACAPLFPWPSTIDLPHTIEPVIVRLARLFGGLLALSALPTEDPADPPPVWTRRGLISLLRGLSHDLHQNVPLDTALRDGLLRTVVARALTPARQRAVADLLNANELGPQTWRPTEMVG